MKLRFSSLEEARRNPIQFALKKEDENLFIRSRFKTLKNAINKYHKEGINVANRHLEQQFTNNFVMTNSENIKMLDNFIIWLNNYIKSFEIAKYQFIESNKRLSLYVQNFNYVTGNGPIVNNHNDSYFVYDIVNLDNTNWENELKYPLLKHYYSQVVFHCNLKNVNIGIYDYLEDSFKFLDYTNTYVTNSYNETVSLLKTISDYKDSKRRA